MEAMMATSEAAAAAAMDADPAIAAMDGEDVDAAASAVSSDRISRLQRWHGNQKKALAKRGGSKQLAPLRLDTTKPQPACPSEQRQCVPRRRGSERQGSTYGPEACYHAHESPREVSE